jgi:hypothetical protein
MPVWKGIVPSRILQVYLSKVKYKKVAAPPCPPYEMPLQGARPVPVGLPKFTPFTLTWLCRKRPVVFDSGGKFTEPPFCQHEHLIRINIACNTENGFEGE